MPKQYDSTSKFLIEEFPDDWLALAGLEAHGPLRLIDANLSTITAEADKVIRVDEANPWLMHVELQASRDPRMAVRLFRYNALLDDRHGLPTRSVLFLLRADADGPELSGDYRRSLPDGTEYLVFRYEVVRVWRQPVESILSGGLGTLPLAPVSLLDTMTIEEVVEVLHERLDPIPPLLGALLWQSTSLLMGLRYSDDMVKYLLRTVGQMKESSVYQAILAEGLAKGLAEGRDKGLAEGRDKGLAEGRDKGLAEGRDKGLAEGRDKGLAEGRVQQRVDGARRLLLLHGERRFGPTFLEDRETIERTTDPDQLENWFDVIYEPAATTWLEFWVLAKKK